MIAGFGVLALTRRRI
ncbi:hypothetical protein [Kineobactrum salinum]